MLYHPDKYKKHNQALKTFVDGFNAIASSKGSEIEMYIQNIENFRDDGGILFKKDNIQILYDFEKRFKYYDSCGNFVFYSLGQFERKIRKEEIKLSMQCSTDEKCFLIAWHDDYVKEEKKKIGSATADGSKEYDGKRFTKDFIELSYDQFDKFYDILLYAFKNNSFNKNSFSVLKNE